MSNNFRIIYLYLVSFITLAMIIGGIVSTVNNITSYFFPDSYVFFEKNEGQDIDTYISKSEKNRIERENYNNERIKDSIISISITVVGVIMYRYHWNTIEKEREK